MKNPTPTRRSTLLLIATTLCGLLNGFQAHAEGSPDVLRVLFLGDNDHHRPHDRYKDLQPLLATHHIRLDYTDSMLDISSAKLAGYDCLLIYANQTRISPEQEKALFDFVSAGGGLVPLHCASFCFLNSSNYIALVGAQFKSHGTGVFKETIVNPDNSIMRGLTPIESWDETYVHSNHNTNRVVLAERRDGDKSEPYTWTRTHGKGRVFYTAWGHDQRTWTNATFQALVERGIRWACEPSPTRLTARTGLKPFEYTEAPAPLPNYVAGARWGTQAEPIRTMQKPLPPEESMQHLVTMPGFDVQLFATEPDIAKPIWMAWDERGRLWIAETVDYPNNMQSVGEGHDRIKICEDTDGDGRADKITVFADKLSVPTSFVFANGGIIVVHSGKCEFLQDTDGDDKADVRRDLFKGWGTQDTHAGPSNLRYGFDNWIWGTVGYSGFEGKVGGKSIRFGQGIFRFKPDGSALEFVRASNNNTWGLGISEDNLIFGSTANGNASMYMPIPNRYYEAVNGWSASRLETSADSQSFFAITEKVRQVDWHGQYTAGAGSALYTARGFPKQYWNAVQFVAEPTGHLLGKFHLEARGSDFVAHNGRNFAASDDEWTSPICAEVGPDAALWVIDWYNYIVQHNPTPNGFQTGKGNAYVTPLRDKTHGRIYRIVNKEASAPQKFDLRRASADQLVEALKSDNMLWRITAQRLLVERKPPEATPLLAQLAQSQTLDGAGMNPPAIHALWTLDGMSMFNDSAPLEIKNTLIAALDNPAAGVRRAGVALLPRSDDSTQALLSHKLLEDRDPQTRLATLLALSEMPKSDAAGKAIAAILLNPKNSEDRWIPDACTSAAARHDSGFLQAIAAALKSEGAQATSKTNENSKGSAAIAAVVGHVSAHYAQHAPMDSILPLLGALSGVPSSIATPFLDGLVNGWPPGKAPKITPRDKSLLIDLLQALPESARGKLVLLARKWGNSDMFSDAVANITTSLKTRLADSSLPAPRRISAAQELIAMDDTPANVETVLKQVNRLTAPELANGLIGAVATSKNPATASALLNQWSELSPSARRTDITALLRRPEWTTQLLDAIEKGIIQRTDLAVEQWSQLKSNPNGAIARRSERLSNATGAITADRAEIVKKLLPLAKESDGDPVRGKEVFKASCFICHTVNSEGGKVGPDLSGIGARDHSEILIDILDPNRSVEANYRMWNVSTRDGEVFSGRLEVETQTSVEILDAAGQKHVIQRGDIEKLEGSKLSIMPNGFESIPPADLKALLAFLTQPPK